MLSPVILALLSCDCQEKKLWILSTYFGFKVLIFFFFFLVHYPQVLESSSAQRDLLFITEMLNVCCVYNLCQAPMEQRTGESVCAAAYLQAQR